MMMCTFVTNEGLAWAWMGMRAASDISSLRVVGWMMSRTTTYLTL